MTIEEYRAFYASIMPKQALETRIEDAVNNAHRPYWKGRISVLQRGMVAAVLIVVLSISAGAAYLVGNWDQLFLGYFSPTEEQRTQLDAGIQDIQTSAEQDGMRFSVGQMICVENSIYMTMEIEFSQAVSTPMLSFVQCGLAHVEAATLLNGLSEWAADDYGYAACERILSDAELSEGSYSSRKGYSILAQEYDRENSRLSVLLEFHYEKPVSQRDCTLVIHQVTAMGQGNLLSAPVVLNFFTDSAAETMTYSVYEQGQQVGTMKLTPLTAEIVFPARTDGEGNTIYSESWIQMNRIQVTLDDGRKIVFSQGYTTEDDTEMTAFRYVSEIIELRRVVSISCGDLEFRLIESHEA